MAGTSLLALIDDIASILDDVALMTKIAAKKTAGVLGDDLALNANQVTGVNVDRELPVVWAVAKGSLKNKLILVPLALIISALAHFAITPLLMLGGIFLCYEGFEKLAHKLMSNKVEDKAHQTGMLDALADPAVDIVNFEKDKIKGAIRTDFILSAEIITISLGTVASAPLGIQLAVLTGIALIMTAGVYGLVAGIVKLDDIGLYLTKKNGNSLSCNIQRNTGTFILLSTPYIMKGLSFAGTAAMFMVGGGILAHGIPGAQELIHRLTHNSGAIFGIGKILEFAAPVLLNALAGITAGAITLACVAAVSFLFNRQTNKNAIE